MSKHALDEESPTDLVRVGVAASIVARVPKTLDRWVALGRLREFRDGRGVRYYSRAELRDLAPRPVAIPEAARA